MSSLRDAAIARDVADPLARFRAAFSLPAGVIYLNGNSLGPPPGTALASLAAVATEEWGQGLIGSWNSAGWIEAPTRIGDKIARLIGAKAGEVVVADSTSVNLFKLAAGALSLRPGRRTILSEVGNFPTDLYVLQGLSALTPGQARLKAVAPEALIEAIDADVAVVVLTQVHYKSSRRWDMAAVTAAAHAKGALILWDLSHSTGAVAVDLGACRADLAIGCGYKYLNGGPGAPAYLFVAQRHQQAIRSPLTGWMGHAEPFAFDDDYRPAPDIRAQVTGTPPILGLAALEAGVDLQLEADPAQVEAKGAALAEAFRAAVSPRLEARGLDLASPAAAADRGLHLAFRHPAAYAIVRAMAARGVIGDFRAPDAARFGFSPLFLSYLDIHNAAEHFVEVVESGEFNRPEHQVRAAVT